MIETIIAIVVGIIVAVALMVLGVIGFFSLRRYATALENELRRKRPPWTRRALVECAAISCAGAVVFIALIYK